MPAPTSTYWIRFYLLFSSYLCIVYTAYNEVVMLHTETRNTVFHSNRNSDDSSKRICYANLKHSYRTSLPFLGSISISVKNALAGLSVRESLCVYINWEIRVIWMIIFKAVSFFYLFFLLLILCRLSRCLSWRFLFPNIGCINGFQVKW